MHCESAARKLAAAALDELSAPDREELQAHLAACTRCRADAEALGAAAAAVRGLPEVAASSERRERALEAMRRGAAERLARPRSERVLHALVGRQRLWAVAGLFAASVAGIVLSGLLPLVPPAGPALTLTAESVSGEVEVERAPLAPSERVVPGMRLAAGAKLRVRDGAHAVLRASNGGLIECAEATSLRIEPTPAGSEDHLFTLLYGKLWCELTPLLRGHYVIRDVRDRKLTVVGTKFEVVAK